MNVLKFVSLFVAVWLTIVNTGKFIRKHELPTLNIVFQAIGISAFVYLQWLV